MYFEEDPNNPLKVPSCIYNNTCIVVELVRKKYTVDEMRGFLENYGYYYPNEEIDEFLGNQFFKKKMDSYLKQIGAEDEIKDDYQEFISKQSRNIWEILKQKEKDEEEEED